MQVPRLSNREREVLEHLLQGKSNKLIAADLFISDRTVEFHLKNIYAKFDVSSKFELILALGNATGWPDLEKLGIAPVVDEDEFLENRDTFNFNVEADRPIAPSATVSKINQELDMKQTLYSLLYSNHVRAGAVSAVIAGIVWYIAVIRSYGHPPDEQRVLLIPIALIWIVIGLGVGLIGERLQSSLVRVSFSAMLGTGLSSLTIIPLILMVVMPIGKVVEWLGLINSVPSAVAAHGAMISMMGIWLLIGLGIGIGLLFLEIKKSKEALFASPPPNQVV